MNTCRWSAPFLGFALLLTLVVAAQASPKSEIKGAAILDHPCGKVAVKHMALVYAGKMDEATKLGTKEMQEQWQKMPVKDRTMMSEMMKAMAQPEPQFSASIKANGLLAVEGNAATLTVKTEHKDASGSSTETWSEKYALDGGACLITH